MSFQPLFGAHQDHLLPLMSDLRFAPDTLFLVAEEDWRLWESDCAKGRKLGEDHLPDEREGELSAPSREKGPWSQRPFGVDLGPEEEEVYEDPRWAGLPKAPKRERPREPEQGPRGWGRPEQAKAGGLKVASQELVDIVHICNEAHRAGHGELVWLCWNSSKAAPWTVTYGSTLLAISARGARILKHHFAEQFPNPSHFDLALKTSLQNEDFQKIVKACYVWPSLGGFDDHQSAFQNTKVAEVRECSWKNNEHRQEGTREFDETGRAFSRSGPWHQWTLKLFPHQQKRTFERTLCEVATLPIGEPCIWWTAACSIFDTSYVPDTAANLRSSAKKQN